MHFRVKMYKQRFTQWGLSKNKKRQHAISSSQRAVHPGRAEIPAIRGRPLPFGFERFHDQSGFLVAARNPSKAPSPPDDIKCSEESLVAVMHWARGRMEINSFGINDKAYNSDGDLGIRMWYDFTLSVKDSTPLVPVIEFRLLNKAFSWYSDALDAAEPSLVWISLITVLEFVGKAGEELGNSFTRYLAGLCSIKLGPLHPLSRLWSKIDSMSIQQLRDAAPAILDAYFDSYKSHHRMAEIQRRVAVIHVVRSLIRWNIITFDSASTRTKEQIEQFRLFGGYDDLEVDWYWWSQLSYCALLRDAGRFEEANEVLLPVGTYMHRGFPEFTFDKVRLNTPAKVYYEVKAEILDGLGRMDEATSYWLASFEYCKLKNDRMKLAKAAQKLQDHYRKKGDVESALKIQADVTAYLDALIHEKVSELSGRREDYGRRENKKA